MAPRGSRRGQVLATVIPLALVVVPLAVLGAFKPYKVSEAIGSPQAMALFAGLGLLWVLAAVVLWRFTSPVARGVVMGGVSVALAAVLIVPSLRDVRVVEDRHDLATARTVDPSPSSTAPPPGDDPTSTTTTTIPVAPLHVGSGPLRGIGHGASGTANLFRLPDGNNVVELLDIDIDPGPDYIVYLAPGLETEEPGEGSIELAALKGNLGTQYYDVPSGANLGGEWSVLIWCRAFAVPVAAAALLPV